MKLNRNKTAISPKVLHTLKRDYNNNRQSNPNQKQKGGNYFQGYYFLCQTNKGNNDSSNINQ